MVTRYFRFHFLVGGREHESIGKRDGIPKDFKMDQREGLKDPHHSASSAGMAQEHVVI